MERKYTVYYNGIKFDVVEARADATHDVQISVLGKPNFKRDYFNNFSDEPLLGSGWKELAVVNGSLFFTEGDFTFANGIVKSKGVLYENDDAHWDKNFAFYHEQSVPYFYTQAYIKTILSRDNVRGAVTCAFGLLNNGYQDISGARKGEPCRTIYLQKSGRTIIGKRRDNTIVMATCDGVTGKTGLTGYQTYLFARNVLKLRNAGCMDGGGSTFMKYKGKIINNSSRLGATAVGLYYREK